MKGLNRREKPPIVYHHFNASINTPSLNIQMMEMAEIDEDGLELVLEPRNSTLVVMASHEALPTLKRCDYWKAVRDFPLEDGDFADWFIDSEAMKNRTGKW